MIAESARLDALLMTVGPKANALETSGAIAADLTQTVLAAGRQTGYGGYLANRCAARAARVHAGRSRRHIVRGRRSGAFTRAIAVDISAPRRRQIRAIVIDLAALVHPQTELGVRLSLANVPLWTVEVVVTGQAPIDAAAGDALAGESNDAVSVVVAARRLLDAPALPESNVDAVVLGTAIVIVDARPAWCGQAWS